MPIYNVEYTGETNFVVEADNASEAELAAGELLRDEFNLNVFEAEEIKD